MSWQQVNLYLPELKPKDELLSFNAALFIGAAICLLLLILSVVGKLDNNERARSSQAIAQQLEQQAQEINHIKTTLPLSEAALVQQKVDKLRSELQRRQRIHQLINQQNLGNSDGFSNQLVALARQHQNTVSVGSFQIVAGGRYFYFGGKATSAQSVPQYLQRLQTEPAFGGTRFGHLVLERSQSGIVNFSLSRETQVSKAGR